MAATLLHLLENEFSEEVVSNIASAVGEDESATRKAVAWMIPTVLRRLGTMASNPTGAGHLFAMLHESGLDGRRLGPIAATLASRNATNDLLPIGHRAVSSLFGTDEREFAESLVSCSGVRRSSSQVLLGLIVPLVMDFVANHAADRGGFSPRTLSKVLTAQNTVALEADADPWRSQGTASRWRWTDVVSWTWPIFLILAIYWTFWAG